MISLRRLIDPHTPQKVCVRTYQLFLEGLEAPQVVERLKREGFTGRIAARATTFIASAFARVHYENEGLTFPTYFYPGFAAYQKGKLLRYEKEPVFLAAMQLAKQLCRDGDSPQVWRFIEISAEHRGIAAIKARGQTPAGSDIIIYEF